MNKLFFGTSLVLGLAATLSIGCSSVADDGSEQLDSEYRKKPTATENWSSLTVQLPTGSCQPGGSCSRPLGAAANITLDGAAIALGAANRIKPGDHTLAVNGAGTKVTLAAGASRTMVLPTARRKCQAAALPSVAQTDFGSTITLSNAACPAKASLVTGPGGGTKPVIELHYYNWGCPAANITGTLDASSNATTCAGLRADRIYSVKVNGVCTDLQATRPDGQNGISPAEACNSYVAGDTSWLIAAANNGAVFADYDLAYVPGEYSLAIPSGSTTTTQKFTLKEGDTSEIAVALPVIGAIPATFATSVKFLDPRELPDAQIATITSSCPNDRKYNLPATSTTALNLKAFVANCVYTFNAAGRTVTLNQTASNAISMNRLDVDNVTVTRENGTTYEVAGKYELFFGGTRVAGPFNTNSGIDVLPGTYELVTSFSTADGPQTQRETLTF
ncbi:MAG: hypothetical protein JWP87_6416 [Labilithrix sp.]|nr:hypothetical protein [Labilithrix sp.]